LVVAYNATTPLSRVSFFDASFALYQHLIPPTLAGNLEAKKDDVWDTFDAVAAMGEEDGDKDLDPELAAELLGKTKAQRV
jgi:hypothetical protein